MKPLVVAIPGDRPRAGPLARRIGGEVADTEIRSFPDGETYVRIDSPVQGRHVVVTASLEDPDTSFMTGFFVAETARDLKADSVGLVAPYLPYLRQDARFQEGEGVTSRYFGNLVSEVFDWLVTVDPHLHRHDDLGEIYSIPTAAVGAAAPIADWIDSRLDDPLIVGPDEESRQWVSAVARQGGFGSLILEKTRRGDYDVDIEKPDIDSDDDRKAVVVDDIISTGRTMAEAVERLDDRGLAEPICIGIHGLFADDALSTLRSAGVDRVATTNTVVHETNAIDVTDQLVEGIDRMLAADASVPVPSTRSGTGS